MHVTQPQTFQSECSLLTALQCYINSLDSILENMGKQRAEVEKTDEKESFDQFREQVKNIRDHAIEEQGKLTQPVKPTLSLVRPQ